eukprot:scaffold1449_cov324-Prasinococcus_capsulatus_cf.AAC.15
MEGAPVQGQKQREKQSNSAMQTKGRRAIPILGALFPSECYSAGPRPEIGYCVIPGGARVALQQWAGQHLTWLPLGDPPRERA